MPETRTVVLSRFFDENVLLVAGLCAKCYSEPDDVKIVAVSRKFLKQTLPRELCNNIPISRGCASREKTGPIRSASPKRANDDLINTQPRVNLSNLKATKDASWYKSSTPNSPLDSSTYPLWYPPKSPHNLVEEAVFHDPWSLLVATIFLNKTACMSARPYIEKFLEDFPEPQGVLQRSSADLEKYFGTLGLHRRRAEQVWKMSYDYVHKNWRSADELYGIGKYGNDAYRMFILGDLDVEPTDRFLRIYRDWCRKFNNNFIT